MQEVKLKELVALVNKELVKRGYHKKTIAIYNRAWQFLVKCFDAKKEEFFSLNTAMRILEEECNFLRNASVDYWMYSPRGSIRVYVY